MITLRGMASMYYVVSDRPSTDEGGARLLTIGMKRSE